MKALVTGSSGHLGEALVRTLRATGNEVVGLDIAPSPFTTTTGSVDDAQCVARCVRDVEVIYHTATLHKPHVATHSKQAFIDTNVSGTLTLLEAAAGAGVGALVFTSTTSTFGDSLRPAADAPAAWITEDTESLPRNIYGVTKTAAEDLCHLFYRKARLPCIVLRTSRFFGEEDDDPNTRAGYSDLNAKINEFPFRRVDLEDVASAHLLAAKHARQIGFGRYIVSATSPFQPADLTRLRRDAAGVLKSRAPDFESVYESRGWRMFPGIDRVYDNTRARRELGWAPRYDFGQVLARLRDGGDPFSPITRLVGCKGYHAETFDDGPYPVEPDH